MLHLQWLRNSGAKVGREAGITPAQLVALAGVKRWALGLQEGIGDVQSTQESVRRVLTKLLKVAIPGRQDSFFSSLVSCTSIIFVASM